VTDASLLNGVFSRFRPSIVYHAAALKHVPLLELNPLAAVRNNAIGTYTLAEAARHHGVSTRLERLLVWFGLRAPVDLKGPPSRFRRLGTSPRFLRWFL
jgi:nucleoside-diphosphate-sugar epimerase